MELELSISPSRIAGESPRPQRPYPLPKAKPRTLREHIVVPSIRSRKIARAQPSNVRHREDALKVFDFGNSLPGAYSVPISNIRVRDGQTERYLRIPTVAR